MTDQVAELYRLSALVRLRFKRSQALYELLCRLGAQIGPGKAVACAADADGYLRGFIGVGDGGSFLEIVCKADEPDRPPVTELGVVCKRAYGAWRRAAIRYTAAHEAFRAAGEQFLAGLEKGASPS
jgi:hypothetical protein